MAHLTPEECITVIFGSAAGSVPAELDTDRIFQALNQRGLKTGTSLAIDMALGQHRSACESQGMRGEAMVSQVRKNFGQKLTYLLEIDPDFLELVAPKT